MSVAFAGSWQEVIDNRPAFLSAIAGTAVTCALLAAAAFGLKVGTEAASRPEAELRFVPGSIARLGIDDALANVAGTGVVAPPTAPTEPAPVVDPTTPEPPVEPATAPAVTRDDTPPATKRPRPSPRPPRPAPLPAPSSTPGKLPTVGKGNPFASPKGWSEMDAPGDAWATSVVAALSRMQVGAFAADLSGTYRFKIKICSDGKIGAIEDRGGNISASGRAAVKLALKRLELPRPPASVRKHMTRKCQKLAHTFVWTSTRVR